MLFTLLVNSRCFTPPSLRSCPRLEILVVPLITDCDEYWVAGSKTSQTSLCSFFFCFSSSSVCFRCEISNSSVYLNFDYLELTLLSAQNVVWRFRRLSACEYWVRCTQDASSALRPFD